MDLCDAQQILAYAFPGHHRTIHAMYRDSDYGGPDSYIHIVVIDPRFVMKPTISELGTDLETVVKQALKSGGVSMESLPTKP